MQDIISKTIAFVKTTLANAESGHDWFHIERVYNNTLLINSIEKANSLVVALAALLHDIADSKFHDGDEELGPQRAGEFLSDLEVDHETILHVQNIIRHMSFKNSFAKKSFNSLEMKVVQDADRLDAIGAIGIARAFTYGGYKNRTMYDPAILPNLKMSKEEYKNSAAPTINHFYEKLLLLKDRMNTKKGMELAEARHQFMLDYLDQFYSEWRSEK